MTDSGFEDPAAEIVRSRDSVMSSSEEPEDTVLTVAMSIYAQLVSQALGGEASKARTAGEALAELLHCRGRLDDGATPRSVPGWASSALADQLAYDVALIVFARYHDIECDPLRFEQPQEERLRLEQKLASRGIRLSELDGL